MPDDTPRETRISTQSFRNMRFNVELLGRQLDSGKIEKEFLVQQIRKLQTFFENLEAERAQARRSSQFEALYNVSRMLGSSLELQEVLNRAMDAALELTGGHHGFLTLLNDEGELEVVVQRQFQQENNDDQLFNYSRTVASKVLETGESILMHNAASNPEFSNQDSVMGQSLRSVMATPLRVRGETIGVAYVDSRAEAGLFDETDLNALEMLGGQAAIAIENARLFEHTDQALTEKVNELRQLRQVDRLLNETLDMERVVQLTLEWAGMLSNSAGGYLGLLDANNTALPTAGSFGIDDDAAVPNRLDKAYPLVWEAMQEDDPMMVRQTVLGRVRSLLVVPIWLQSRAMGAVVLFRADVSPYTTQQMNLATGVVSRGAVAIENGRLYAAVQAANTAKSEFVSTVAHELRNPMSNIVGYANLVQQADNIHHNLVGRQREFVNNIERVVGHMDRLVGDLTDISQIETGHLAMEETRVRVDEVAREIREDTRLQIEEREQTYVEDIADDLPDLYADPVRLAQVLTNLVSNAYKYTKPGGTITLRARQDGDWVAFTVADTGIGLTDEQQAMLGTKFWRANNEYTRRQRGTGLGFTITQHLVALMGSEIQVESEVDEGSAFTFRVPVFDGDDDPESTQILPRLQLDDN